MFTLYTDITYNVYTHITSFLHKKNIHKNVNFCIPKNTSDKLKTNNKRWLDYPISFKNSCTVHSVRNQSAVWTQCKPSGQVGGVCVVDLCSTVVCTVHTVVTQYKRWMQTTFQLLPQPMNIGRESDPRFSCLRVVHNTSSHQLHFICGRPLKQRLKNHQC